MYKTVTICDMGGVEPISYDEIDPESIQKVLIEITRCANDGIYPTETEIDISSSVSEIEIKRPM